MNKFLSHLVAFLLGSAAILAWGYTYTLDGYSIVARAFAAFNQSLPAFIVGFEILFVTVCILGFGAGAVAFSVFTSAKEKVEEKADEVYRTASRRAKEDAEQVIYQASMEKKAIRELQEDLGKRERALAQREEMWKEELFKRDEKLKKLNASLKEYARKSKDKRLKRKLKREAVSPGD